MMRLILILLLLLGMAPQVVAQWTPDHLGDGFMMHRVALPDDYSGKVRATVVRKLARDSRRAVVYVHGYNDYFFQTEMANRMVDSCFNFYAVDLRKYGRSLLPGQVRFEVRDLAEYFPEIDSVMTIAVRDGNTSILLMGHSTGGLITSYYMAKGRGDRFPVRGLILNSPFLDMNLSPFLEDVAVPLVSFVSPVLRNIKVSESDGNAYAQSLLRRYHGEWDYNTRWKLEYSPDLYSAWLGAIHKAHVYVQQGTDIRVPILLMYSARSVSGSTWTPDFNDADAVLDVNDIARYGQLLGADVHHLRVHGGLHDLVLSRRPVREALYKAIFRWIHSKIE